jgi:hypothetical protein
MDTQPEISLVGDRVSHMRLCRFGIFRSACWRQEGVAEGSKYPSVRSLSTSDYMNTGPTIKPLSINLLKYKHQVLYTTTTLRKRVQKCETGSQPHPITYYHSERSHFQFFSVAAHHFVRSVYLVSLLLLLVPCVCMYS